jgi:purine-binding chemotaxis protein CheW
MLDKLLALGQDEIQMITFTLSKEDYAIPIDNIQEIITYQDATRIPKSPSFVEGVINLRGHTIPIIDGNKRLNFSKGTNDEKMADKEDKIIIIELEKDMVGFIVNSVSEVIHIKVNDIEPPPVDSNENTDFIWGIGKYHKHLLILLDIEKLFNFDNIISNLSDLSKVKDKIGKKLKKNG